MTCIVKQLVKYIETNNIKNIDINDIDELLIKIEDQTKLNLSELPLHSDEDIQKIIEQLTQEGDERKQIIKLIIDIKTAQTIKYYETESKDEDNHEEKNYLRELFSDIATPEKIDIDDKQGKVKIVFPYNPADELLKKVDEIKKWIIDNAPETISKELGVPTNNIQIIRSVNDYVRFVSDLDDEEAYVSRGQKDCTFKLSPSLHRAYSDGYPDHSTVLETEFKQKVSFYDESLNRRSDEEVRAYAQHFGLPTNYLDFTEAHLISLLFAVEDYDYTTQHSIVYFANALSYNTEVLKQEVKLVDYSNNNEMEEKEKKYRDKSYFIKVRNSNERIHFQKGCFLKVADNGDLTSLLKNHTKIVLIDKEYKKQILKDLFKLGITFENIYPDKDNVVKTIKFLNNI